MIKWMSLAGLMALSMPAAAGSSVRASSELEADGETMRAAMAFDGELRTAWVEGDDGHGIDSWLELSLDRAREVSSISIWVGDLSRGRRSLRERARAHTITVTLTNGETSTDVRVRIPDLAVEGPKRVDVSMEPTLARTIRFRVDEVYPTFVSPELAIAEVAINYVDGEVPSSVESTLKWLESSAGKRSVERAEERARELFDTLSSDDEDRDALTELVDRAADGLTSMRGRARSVPFGFRVQAVPSDDMAVEALLKLKNPNGIPGVELAATRARGKEQRKLQLKSEMFYAYQELLGGPAPVPNWGRAGWEVGAMHGFGEPLNIARDSLGQTYVADIGNHRVQRFNDEGVSNGAWGSCEAPDIANRWFGITRPYHVTACLPSEADGGFINPLDVAVVPGKSGDGFAVLDVTGRIQVFDGEGAHVQTIATDLGSMPTPGVGGQGFLELIKNKFVAVMGDEVGVYSKTGEKLSEFVLEYGGSSGAVGLKNGKLALIQGRELVMFSLDGFEHGAIVDESVLGTNFEYWDVALDDKGKLWALLDSGRVIRFKKPGSPDWEGTWGEGAGKPRAHVFNGVLFVSHDDAIELIDTGTGK